MKSNAIAGRSFTSWAGLRPLPELAEPPVPLAAMRDGREVVEDYRGVGLSLRRHPVTFLRATLQARGMVACGDLGRIRDGRRVIVPDAAFPIRPRRGDGATHPTARDP